MFCFASVWVSESVWCDAMVIGHSSKAGAFRKNALSYVVFHKFCAFACE